MKKVMLISLLYVLVCLPLTAWMPQDVKTPPQQGAEMQANGQRMLPNAILPKGTRFTFKIVPDPDFKSLMPQDCRYGVTEVRFLVQQGLGQPTLMGKADLTGRDAVEGLDIPVPSEIFQYKNARVFMEIKDVYRLNFKGEKIKDSRVSAYEKVFSFMTK